jgi:hypothetical protein
MAALWIEFILYREGMAISPEKAQILSPSALRLSLLSVDKLIFFPKN